MKSFPYLEKKGAIYGYKKSNYYDAKMFWPNYPGYCQIISGMDDLGVQELRRCVAHSPPGLDQIPELRINRSRMIRAGDRTNQHRPRTIRPKSEPLSGAPKRCTLGLSGFYVRMAGSIGVQITATLDQWRI